jgi:GT2 family glycosyltransferase
MTEANRPWASIIIVNFNAGEFLQPALDAVAAQSDQDFELILVDNASTDGSTAGLQLDQFQSVTFMPLTENTGFARGNNLAAAKARGEWLILLNPDTLAAPDWLSEFRAATRAHPDTSMFAGATIDMTDTDKLDGAGDCYLVAGLPWRGGYQRPATELPKAGTCFSPCGASAMFRRELFLQAGGFDETYFCYCEDVDLGFRLRLEGYECVFWPNAKAAHFGSASSGVASPFAVRHGTRNRLWTFFKNMPPIALIALLPVHFLLTLVLVLRAIPQGRARPTLAGLREGLAGLGTVFKARKAVQARRRLSSFEILKAMTWNPITAFTRRPDVRAFAPKEDRP